MTLYVLEIVITFGPIMKSDSKATLSCNFHGVALQTFVDLDY